MQAYINKDILAGLVPIVRAWAPSPSPVQLSTKESSTLHAEFHPVMDLREMDGSRKTALLMHGSYLIIGDSSAEGLITIFDINTWTRTHTIKTGAPVTLLKASSKILVAGTSHGKCHAWHLPQSSSDSSATQPGMDGLARAGPLEGFLVEDPSPAGNPRPCTTLALGTMPDGSDILVALSPLACKLKVWRLPEGKLLQALVQPVTEDNAESRAVRTNVVFSFCEGPMFTTISYLPGHDPVVQVMDLLARHAEDVNAPERLGGRGRPTSACFNGGKILAVGFEDGAVAAFGMFGWLGFHKGAQVGCVRVLPDRLQVLSGGSDGRVKLWSAKGHLLSTLELGFQVTTLSELAEGGVIAAGGNKGEVQLVILPLPSTSDESIKEASSSSSTPTPPRIGQDDVSNKEEKQSPEGKIYDLFFDLRPSLDPLVLKASGRVNDHPEAYHSFLGCNGAFTRKEVTAAQVLSYATSHARISKSPEEVKRSEAALAEAVRKKQIEGMGEDKGVARTPGLSGASLDSSTARNFGRKCSNPSCMIREGIAELKGKAFKRCSACKSVFYCSEHCQRTHYRDGHKKECLKLAEALKALELRQREEEKEEEEEAKKEALNSMPPPAPPAPPASAPAPPTAPPPGPAPTASSPTVPAPSASPPPSSPTAPAPTISLLAAAAGKITQEPIADVAGAQQASKNGLYDLD